MCDCCNQYEINKCQEYNAKSMKISQLKAQIAQLDDNDRAYNALLQKYCQLQNEYQLLNDSKIHLEYELRQKNETTNKILNDLKCQNMDLTNELSNKNNIYQKLTADNTNLFHNLDERKKENENFLRTVSENENLINHITQEKINFEHDAMVLNDANKKNEENIKNLCDQLNCLKLKNQNQNDELNSKNIELNDNQKCLNEIQCDNTNLNNQINLKNSQLVLANKSIANLTAEINAKRDEYEKGKVQLQSLKINFQNEHDKRIKAENDNVKLEGILKESEDTLNKLNYLNNTLKCDRSKLCEDKTNLLNDLEKYKNHAMILTDQTEKLTNELQKIIDEDTGLYNLNNSQIQRLQQIIYENKKLLSDEIAALNALENYVKCPPECKIEKCNPEIKKTYSLQNY